MVTLSDLWERVVGTHGSEKAKTFEISICKTDGSEFRDFMREWTRGWIEVPGGVW
jgi:hypothetical protein